MSRVIPFPLPARRYNGTVCVMGDKLNGFEVAHESASGDSWGFFSTHNRGQEAITAAFALNRDVYLGDCNVAICDEALRDRDADPASLPSREDF